MANTDRRLRRKVRNSYIISTVSIALVLFLLGAVAYLMTAAIRIADSLQQSVTIIVELRNDAGEEQRAAIRKHFEESPMVADVTFSSKEEKLEDEEFRKIFAAEFEEVLDENPLLDSYEVRLSARSEDREALDAFIDEATTLEGVEHVSYPAQVVEKMHSTINKVRPLLLVFAAVLLVISLTLLNSTIRLAIFSKRYVINTMKLVGATKWFIMKPFLWRGFKQGVAAGVMAAVLFGATIYGIDRTLPEISSHGQMMAAAAILCGMILVGVIVSLLFTAFAVNKFVNMKSNKIYLY